MAGVQKVRPWLFLVTGSLLVALLGLVAYQHFRPGDPCAELGREELLARYPALEDLSARQQEETDRLLARHRAQDIAVNLQLGSDRISPDEALHLSLNQVNELSELRTGHKEIFYRTCREVAGGGPAPIGRDGGEP